MPPKTPPPLSAALRQQYRAEAQHLKPVVLIGAAGLTDAVQKEVDAALAAHGLIKVRVAHDERAARQQMLEQLCAQLGAQAVQHIGKVLLLLRPRPPKQAAGGAAPGKMPAKAPQMVKVVKPAKRPGQRPTVQQLRLLGNQRLTAGGQVKRARVRQTSPKKSA